MSCTGRIGRIGQASGVDRFGGATEFSFTSAVGGLHVDGAHLHQLHATGIPRRGDPAGGDKFKRFGEIAWRQFGRQGKGGAN